MEKQRILAINFGGIGDEILFLPVLKSLRQAYPNAEITLLVEPRSCSIKQITDLFDHVIVFDIKKSPLLVKDLLELLTLVKAGSYDVVLSSGSSPLVSMLLFLSGIRKRIGYDTGLIARCFLTKAVPLNYNQYAADMYHDLVQGLGLQANKSIPQINCTSESRAYIYELLSDTVYGINTKAAEKSTQNIEKRESNVIQILLHPGTSKLAIRKGIIKTWPARNWAILIEKLIQIDNMRIVLAGGPDDEEIVAEIEECVPNASTFKHRFTCVSGKTRYLADLAALIENSDLLVCVDSAPMHLAVGLGKPLVALFGPTDAKKLLPCDKRFKVVHSSIPHANGVQLLPDIVYQSVVDQLKEWTDPKHRLASRLQVFHDLSQ